ncbi:MAG: murein biosynthesis integral membrane protein MurJ [Silicimonas sp.]|nr:murein biosynthesis integral membrane protein MurJ [Silicimonas sp.]
MAHQIRLISGALTVGVWTLLSRILGFVRDVLIAAWLGTGPVAEAFLIAFALPNMFRRFFAEGAFNMAFVPLFSKKLEARADAEAFARDAFSGLATLLVVFTFVATLFMPWLVIAMASGFVGDERFDLTVTLGRVVFPYILFISLAALVSGVLNASGRFAAAAAAPVFLNVILISALLLASSAFADRSILPEGTDGGAEGTALAFGVILAGAVQLAIVWIAARRAGFDLRPKKPVWTPELKRLAIIAAPAALAGGVVQVNLLIGRQVASFFDGAVAWLSYADRLYQLPLGVVGIAIGIVLLPDLSRRLQAEDTKGGQHALSRAAEMSMALAVPAAVALLVIPVALVRTLFERGAFGADDTAATAFACAVYGLGLPAFILQKVVQPLYFAREDTKRPFYYALVALVVNAVIAIGLSPMIGFIAAAIATTLAGWSMLALLWFGTRGMGQAARFDDRAKRRIRRVVVASLIMGIVLWLGQFLLSPLLDQPGLSVLGLTLLCTLGAVVYAATGFALGAFDWAELKGAFRRQR